MYCHIPLPEPIEAVPSVGFEVTEKYDPERPSTSVAVSVPLILLSSLPEPLVSPENCEASLGVLPSGLTNPASGIRLPELETIVISRTYALGELYVSEL